MKKRVDEEKGMKEEKRVKMPVYLGVVHGVARGYIACIGLGVAPGCDHWLPEVLYGHGKNIVFQWHHFGSPVEDPAADKFIAA